MAAPSENTPVLYMLMNAEYAMKSANKPSTPASSVAKPRWRGEL